MAIYAISDIHGAFDEFQKLLDRIHFQYDGSDILYLLGDYGDWGGKSMDVLQLVKQMDEKYSFVHCLMGNHELMFLSAMEYGIHGDLVSESAENWLVANHGLVTWNAFMKLSNDEQEELHDWLTQLPYSLETDIDGRLVMLAHAYPYFNDIPYTPMQTQQHRMDAVWRRLLLRENPFAAYTGKKQYDLLICGHTISDYYYQQVRLEQNLSIVGAMPPGKNRIFRSRKFIDIDCGAKCFDMLESSDPVKKDAAVRAQLAAYCLDRDEETYVSRPQGTIGEMVDGSAVPELTVPDVGVPEFHQPERSGPEWRVPEVANADAAVDYPDVPIPEFHIPHERKRFGRFQKIRRGWRNAREDRQKKTEQ